jgi:Zn-dependent peptidase ImmA (M78 family)
VSDTTVSNLGVLALSLVFRVRMADGVAARTDGVDIWVDDRLNEIQERCAIEHELEHIARGHSTVQPEAIEMSVRYAVAKRLLPYDHRTDGVVCNPDLKSLAAVAKDLGVTRQVLMDRAVTATDEEARVNGCLSCFKCPAIAARYEPLYQAHREQQLLVNA